MSIERPPWPDLLSTAGSTPGDCQDCDDRFVNSDGDVMDGTLTVRTGHVVIDSGGLYVKQAADLGGDITQDAAGEASLGRVHVQDDADFLGDVTLLADPDQPMEAATKRYVDAASSKWFDGEGPPVEPVAGASPGDYYLDTTTGNVYQLTVEG